VKDGNGNTHQEKVKVWNPTVANLTLMALGSSAPEILLALLETTMKLDACPGQLGAATIVGSAAFNLFVISGLSIYAVSEENDTDDDRDESTPLGIKKINDMGVFSVTSITSVFAYIWMLICLLDQNIKVYEAWITFSFTFVFVGLAFMADRYNTNAEKKRKLEAGEELDKSGYMNAEFNAIELYRELVKEKQGEKAAS